MGRGRGRNGLRAGEGKGAIGVATEVVGEGVKKGGEVELWRERRVAYESEVSHRTGSPEHTKRKRSPKVMGARSVEGEKQTDLEEPSQDNNGSSLVLLP